MNTDPSKAGASIDDPAIVHPRLGVSSWSLNKALTRGDFPLLELPALAAAHGYGKLEVCHFHFPTLDSSYLAEFKSACESAPIEMYTFLKDNGDPTHPNREERERQHADMQAAIDAATAVGAKRIRVNAGDATASAEALALSADGLLRLADYGESVGVRLITENWHRLLGRPADVLALMERTRGRVGLKLDFGNWPRDRKYDDLPIIAPLAECIHAKADFGDDGRIDRDDFERCLDIARCVNFAGPYILIFASPGDEWAGLAAMRDVALPYVADS